MDRQTGEKVKREEITRTEMVGYYGCQSYMDIIDVANHINAEVEHSVTDDPDCDYDKVYKVTIIIEKV